MLPPVDVTFLLRGPSLSFALLITAPLTLFNLYFVTLSPLAIYTFSGSTLYMVHNTLSLMHLICANFIRNVRITGSYHLEDNITIISLLFLFITCTYIGVCHDDNNINNNNNNNNNNIPIKMNKK